MLEKQSIFDAAEKIHILQREYDSVRAEIISRTNNSYQLIAAAVATAALLANRPLDAALWISAAIVTLGFLLLIGALYRDINALALRASLIEKRINELAGEELLEWESRWGATANGWFTIKRERK